MIKAMGYGIEKEGAQLKPLDFERGDPGPKDVVIDIMYCGICHSDIHEARNEWKNSTYPLVPGHEIIGRVARVGPSVRKFKIGDMAGVGCFVDSCRRCDSCKAGQEQYCAGTKWTYNYKDPKTGGITYGGYSSNIVVDEAYVLKIAKDADPASTAPLLCAGITTYSPMKRWGVGPGKRVGVVGLGGLGHIAVKLAHSLGAHVVLFTTSRNKIDDALRLGADEAVLVGDAKAMESKARSIDFIIDTAAASHDLNKLLSLLRDEGTLVIVGLPSGLKPYELDPSRLVFGSHVLAGSIIGGIRETQEMLDYCAKHGITADIELIPIQKVNEAYERTVKSKVKYRFVIDMSSLKEG